jgi:hypothetical protein
MARLIGLLLITGALFALGYFLAGWTLRYWRSRSAEAVKDIENILQVDEAMPFLTAKRRAAYRRIVKNYKETHGPETQR